MILTPDHDPWNIIEIVIALDSLYQDFDIITTSLLDTNKKSINKIQSILEFKEVKNFIKQAIEDIRDFVIAFRNQRSAFRKKKMTSKDKCYNYYKLEYFGHDCFLSNKRLNRITQ